jgi:hypothetical protein
MAQAHYLNKLSSRLLLNIIHLYLYVFSRSNIIKATLIGFGQIVLLGAIFIYCHNYIKRIIVDNQQKNEATLNPFKSDMDLTGIDWAQVKRSVPQKVSSGIFLDRIEDFDIIHSKWSYEFYAWFIWNPKKISFINLKDTLPGAVSVQNAPVKIVDGSIEHIETHSFYLNAKGDSAYILFHITGATTKFFDVSQYPLDNYLLTLQLEDVNYHINKLIFVADTTNSNVSSRVSVNGFEKDSNFILSKPHTIKSSLGDPRVSPKQYNTYSQLRFAMYIKRGGLGIYFKVFVTLFIAALLGFLSFFAADGDKVRVIVGSLFFAAATLNIIISRIPAINGISIAEIVNDISLITILLIATRETFVAYLFRNNRELNLLNKWITFIILFIFYISINISIPVMCISSLK